MDAPWRLPAALGTAPAPDHLISGGPMTTIFSRIVRGEAPADHVYRLHLHLVGGRPLGPMLRR